MIGQNDTLLGVFISSEVIRMPASGGLKSLALSHYMRHSSIADDGHGRSMQIKRLLLTLTTKSSPPAQRFSHLLNPKIKRRKLMCGTAVSEPVVDLRQAKLALGSRLN